MKSPSISSFLRTGSLAALLAFWSVPAQAITVVTPAPDFGATTSADDVDVQGTAKGTTTTATANVNAGGASPNSPSGTVTVADSSIFTVGQAIVTTVEATTGLPDNTWVREITNATTVRVEGSGLPWGYNKTYTVAANYMNVKNGDTFTAYEEVSAQPTGDVNNLILSGPGSAVTLADSAVLTIHGSISRTGGSGAIASINGSASIKAGGTDADLVVDTPTATDSLQINSFIDANGTGGLTKTGPGTLRIASGYDSLSYTGKTVIDGGRLSLYNPTNGFAEASLGAIPASFEADSITLQNGAILQYSSLGNNNQLTISANRGITLGAGTQTIERLGQNQINLNSVISGAGGLYFNALITNDSGGTGFAVLNAANTFEGDTTFGWGPVITTGSNQKGWSITLGNKDALQNSTVVWENVNGSNENNGRPYKFNFGAGSGTYTLGGLAGSKDADTGRWISTNDANKTIAIGNNDQDTTFNGKISWGATKLEKIGNGTLTLANNNAFTGSTRIVSGTLALGSAGFIDSSSGVEIDPGGVLDTTAQSDFIMNFLVGQGNTFHIDGTGGGSSGSINADGLNIDAATVTIVEDVAADDAAYVLATYTSLTGGTNTFASVSGLPAGYTIDYAFNGGTQIALVSGGGGSPYDTWATLNGLTGAPASSTDPAFDADPNGNGTDNGLEWILGGDPLGAIPSAQPTATADASGLTLTFTRKEDSIGEATLMIEYGTDVQAWPGSVTIGATSSGPDGNGVVVTVNDAPSPDEVTVFIPASNSVGGELYARATATMP